MPHERNVSGASQVSHVSSEDSNSTIDDVYGVDARAIMASDHPTSALEGSAREHIGSFSHSSARWILTPTTIDHRIDSAKVLLGMLDYSHAAGGDHSVRYTASAILACNEVIHDLVDLANTWVRYLLWPCEYP